MKEQKDYKEMSKVKKESQGEHHIKTHDEYEDYAEYLWNLSNEIKERFKMGHGIEDEITLFLIDFEKESDKVILETYRHDVKDRIEKLHNKLQNNVFNFDDCDDCDNDYDLIPEITAATNLKKIKKFFYFDSKLEYLSCDGGDIDSIKTLEDFREADESLNKEEEDYLHDYISEPFSEVRESEAGSVKHQSIVSDSLWVRIIAHRYINELNKFVDIDLFASNWTLYWQIKIAIHESNKQSKKKK